MRKYAYLCFDIAAIVLALVVALYLRNGAVLIEDGQPHDVLMMLLLAALVPLAVLPIMNTHNRIWRYTSSADLSAVMIAAAICVLLVNGGLFLFNRLEIVPRSVPPMHWALIVFMMGGTRLLARGLYGAPHAGSGKIVPQHVLLVGANHTAELYIEFAKKIIPGQIIIEGIVDEKESLIGRSFHQYPVLGRVSQLADILQRLRVHGIVISKLIVVKSPESMTSQLLKHLQECETNEQVELIYFERQIGLSQISGSEPSIAEEKHVPVEGGFIIHSKRFYPRMKRLLDIVASAALIVLCAPLFVLTSLLVIVDVGFPVLFWQKRPGRLGKTFKLYKFRTMRPAGRKHGEDRLVHKSGDRSRTSPIGYWLRRLRLDELPQLFQILLGTMSFIGPRPLLPDDQPEGGWQRLLVRPGITGWAQVNGADALSPQQKLILDIWYIQNQSLWLDLRIAFRTLPVMLQEDQPRLDAVERAEKELVRADKVKDNAA